MPSPLRDLFGLTGLRTILLTLITACVLTNPVRRWIDERKDLKFYATFKEVPSYDAHDGDRSIVTDPRLYIDVTNARSSAQKSAAVTELCTAHYFPAWQLPNRRFYDLVMISSELDMLEIRMETLWLYVDYFIIVESAKTFTGIPKPLVLQEKDTWARFKKFHHKMVYKVVNDPSPYRSMDHWDHEIFLRNSMLTHALLDLEGTDSAAKKGDVILVSDLDELIKPETALVLLHCDFPKRLTMDTTYYFYSYTWQHRGAGWNHPQATTYGGSIETTIMPEALRKELWDPRLVKTSRWKVMTLQEKLDHIGKESGRLRGAGWHCSSCFNKIQLVIDKLGAFSHPEYNTRENRDPLNIIHRYKNGLDLFGRPESEFALDMIPPTDMPEYVLKDNSSGRLQYLVDRNTTYAGFIDAEEMIKHLTRRQKIPGMALTQ